MSPAVRLLPLLLCALALAGCRDKPPGDKAADSMGITPGPPAAEKARDGVNAEKVPPLPELGDFRIAGLLLGEALDADNIVRTDREVFAPGDVVHATVLTVGTHPGLRLQATWVAPDGSTIARTDQPIAPEGPSATTFHISNSAGWPVGEYELRLAINGHPLQGRKFQVKGKGKS